MKEKYFPQYSDIYQEIIALSEQISIMKHGEEGKIDSAEIAYMKLFEGYEQKDPGNRSEQSELEEALDKGDPTEVYLETADVIYYLTKLPITFETQGYLGKLTAGVGLRKTSDLLELARVKYQTRVNAVNDGKKNGERKEIEKERVKQFINDKKPGEINSRLVMTILGQLRSDYSYLSELSDLSE